MFYLFIFESIGTSELALIGLVALIVFGPRRLPDFARTIGKTMAEFRRSTDDFKKTWEKEIAFEDEKNNVQPISGFQSEGMNGNTNSISRNATPAKIVVENLRMPEVREINGEDFSKNFVAENAGKTEKTDAVKVSGDKRDWL